jgi:hypothetical protein
VIDTPPRRVGRVGVVSLVFALAGLLISIYLTVEHYTTSALLACPQSATINRQKVTIT